MATTTNLFNEISKSLLLKNQKTMIQNPKSKSTYNQNPKLAFQNPTSLYQTQESTYNQNPKSTHKNPTSLYQTPKSTFQTSFQEIPKSTFQAFQDQVSLHNKNPTTRLSQGGYQELDRLEQIKLLLKANRNRPLIR